MELIADGLLIATALTAGLYCLVLSRRLGRLSESGNGIGPQIDALDQALAETRAALKETRDGMSEMRTAAKATIAQLVRETERGDDIAERVERGVGEAKATMQRLYELNDRIEAHESAGARSASVEDPVDAPEDEPAPPEIAATPDTEEITSVEWEDDINTEVIEADAATEETDARIGPKVVLPEGNIEVSEPVPIAARAKASEQVGSVLKAERVML